MKHRAIPAARPQPHVRIKIDARLEPIVHSIGNAGENVLQAIGGHRLALGFTVTKFGTILGGMMQPGHSVMDNPAPVAPLLIQFERRNVARQHLDALANELRPAGNLITLLAGLNSIDGHGWTAVCTGAALLFTRATEDPREAPWAVLHLCSAANAAEEARCVAQNRRSMEAWCLVHSYIANLPVADDDDDNNEVFFHKAPEPKLTAEVVITAKPHAQRPALATGSDRKTNRADAKPDSITHSNDGPPDWVDDGRPHTGDHW